MCTSQDTQTHFNCENELKNYLENDSDNLFKLEQDDWKAAIGTVKYQEIMKKRRDKLPWLKECFERLSRATSIQETVTITHEHYRAFFIEYDHPEYRQWKFRKYGMKLSKMELILKQLKREIVFEPHEMPAYNDNLSHLVADYDFKRKRKKFLKKKSVSNDKKTILFWGDGQFNTNFKQNNCSPCHSIRDFFIRACKSKVTVELVDEYHTSKMCSVCENEIDKSNDVSITLNEMKKEYRLRKCTFCLDAQRPHLILF
eukprot:NODE_102_length_20354_cov_0.272018.p5 type:complete len:257 gc:universal NODE_102_length_20354_cov_0.272018:15619-14849(-)